MLDQDDIKNSNEDIIIYHELVDLNQKLLMFSQKEINFHWQDKIRNIKSYLRSLYYLFSINFKNEIDKLKFFFLEITIYNTRTSTT